MNRLIKATALTTLMAACALHAMDAYQPTDQYKLSPSLQDAYDTQLRDAAGEGKIGEVERLLTAGANVNSKGNFNWTALARADKAGHKKISELLIKWGANPADLLNKELLDYAGWGDKKRIELLLEKGAQVNARDISGRTALMRAARHGQEEVCKLLIAQGANINAKADDGDTALMSATEDNHKEICELLIAHGADVHAKNNKGFTALMTALAWSHKDISKLLIDAMIKPTKEELAPIFTMLGIQKKGQDLNLVGRNIVQLIGKDTYNQIVESNKPKVRDQIILVGPDKELQKQLVDYLNMSSTQRLNEQLLATAKEKIEKSKKVEQLISKGAQVNAQDKDGMTPLAWAAALGHKEICQLLITHGAQVNVQARNSMTPLMWAAVTSRKEICELLIEAMVQPAEYQIAHGSIKQHNKSKAKAEILKIEDMELRQELLDYLDCL